MVATTSTVVHTKKLLPGLVTLLLLSTVMLATPTSARPAPPGGGILWLEPEFVNGTEVGLNNTFVVEMWANISTTAGGSETPVYGCFGYEYWFIWNDTLIEIQSYHVFPPEDVWTIGLLTAADNLTDTNANGKNDTHWYAVTALGEPPGWKDGRKIADYTFKVTNDSVVTQSLFGIVDKGFSDFDGNPITIIPEFSAALIIFLFVVTTLAAVLGKKAWLRKRSIHLLPK